MQKSIKTHFSSTPKSLSQKQNITKFHQKSQKKPLSLIIFTFSLLFIIILIFTISWLINYDKTATLDLYVAPSSAEISIGKEKIKSEGKIKLKPGNYTINISKAGFTTFTKELYLEPEKTTTLYEYLTPTSENHEYYQTHPEEQSRVQHISDLNADQDSKNYSSSDPIFNFTPYSSYNDGFSITAHKQENTSKIKLEINLFTCLEKEIPTLKDTALRYLQNHQIDPKNYDLVFSNC